MKRKILSCVLSICMVITMMPSMAFATGEVPETEPETAPVTEPVELDVSEGSIVITADGYKQGTVSGYKPGYTIQDGEGNDAVLNTHTGSYVITQSTESTNNGVRVEGLAEEQTITIKDLNISNPATGAAVVLYKSAVATLLLEGDNTLSGKNSNPGIVVCQNACSIRFRIGTFRRTWIIIRYAADCIPEHGFLRSNLRYNLLSVSKPNKDLNCITKFFPNYCIFRS